MSKHRIKCLGMLRRRAPAVAAFISPSAIRSADYHRDGNFASHHVVHFGCLVNDLVVTNPNEIDEHDLNHRTQPGHRCSNRSSNKSHLRYRSVDHTLRTKFLDQTARCSQRATPGIGQTEVFPAGCSGDVFPNHNNRWVAPHLETKSLVNSLTKIELAGAVI